MGNVVKELQTLEGWLVRMTITVSPNYEICTSFFSSQGTWVTEKYHVPLALKSEEESKLLVSVSKEVVFVDALDKAFKSIPNLLKF